MAKENKSVATKDGGGKLTKMRLSIVRAFREMVAELKKVTWPTKQELINYTAVVVGFILVMSVLTGLLDAGASWLFSLVIGIGS